MFRMEHWLAALSTLSLLACNGPDSSPNELATANATSTSTAQPTTAGEPGSGTYAANCSDLASAYVVRLAKDEDGMVAGSVTTAGKTYSDLLTSYSFKGDSTPQDFLVAVLFDPANSPVDSNVADGPRIEIWKDSGSYFALVNGDAANRLGPCPA